MVEEKKVPKLLSKGEYYAIVWSLSGISLAFLAARVAIRLKVYRRFMIDDGLVLLAVVCLLASVITNSVNAPTMFVVQAVRINHAKPPEDFEEISTKYAKSQWAVAYCFFTGIWAVKGAFLAFYDDLTKRLKNYRRVWWVANALTILTYIGSLFAYAFLDGMHFRKTLQNEAVKYQFSADLFTDVLITAIPLTLALKSQIPTKQKFALAGVFSLTLIITVFSVIRFVMVSPDHVIAGPSWLQAWSTIEQTVSIMVVCCASFRILIVHRARANSEGQSPRNHYNFMNSFIARARQKQVTTTDTSGFSHLRSHDERSEVSNIELLEQRHQVDPNHVKASNSEESAQLSVQPSRFQETSSV